MLRKKGTSKMTREEFCRKVNITSEQFFGRETIDRVIDLRVIKEIPIGASFNANNFIWMNFLETLPEDFEISSTELVNLESLKEIPQRYSIDAWRVTCNIIIPCSKNYQMISEDFYFGKYSTRRFFRDYYYIKENPSKYLNSKFKIESLLASHFLSRNP
jgi:hypothetical protein